jgi:hypothetical protein
LLCWLAEYPLSPNGPLNAIYAAMVYGAGSGLIYRAGADQPDAFLVIGMAQSAWGGTGFNRLKKAEAERSPAETNRPPAPTLPPAASPAGRI